MPVIDVLLRHGADQQQGEERHPQEDDDLHQHRRVCGTGHESGQGPYGKPDGRQAHRNRLQNAEQDEGDEPEQAHVHDRSPPFYRMSSVYHIPG